MENFLTRKNYFKFPQIFRQKSLVIREETNYRIRLNK